MKKCYHPDVVFNDPAFKNLDYRKVTGMWEMLISRGKDLELSHEQVEANEKTGSAKWIAIYTLAQTGNKVINEINASFEFKDGLIVKHTDDFDFYKWSRQAFGKTGWLLGWTPFFKSKVQKTVGAGLDGFLAKADQKA